MSGANYLLTVRNEAQWPVFLTVGPEGDVYSSCITMGDDSPQLGDTRYLAPGGTLPLIFWRSDKCEGEQGWLALRAAYNPFSNQDDGAWQQFWFDNDGGFSAHGKEASYPNTLTADGRDGDTALYGWSFTDAADWPPDWSRNPVEFSYTNQYDKVWDDSGSGAIFDGSIYKPRLDGYFNLGFSTFGPASYDPVGGVGSRVALVARPLQPGVVVPPDDYEWIGDDHNSGAALDCSWWRPIPPPGFAALGTAFVNYHGKPPRDAIACIRADLAGPAKGGRMVYADRGSGATHDVEIFEVYPDAPGCVQVGASVVSPVYIRGSPPVLSGVPVLTLKPAAEPDRADALTAGEVHAIIARSGPLLLLHPDEIYMPMSPKEFLAAATRTGNYLTADQSVLKGDLATAEAYVFAEYVCSQFTDLQFWFFYGYNGPPSIQVQLWLARGGFFIGSCTQDVDGLNCGQHQGDWEHVTLRVDNRLKQVVAVGYDSHGDTDWHAAPDDQVQCYAGLNMHACYPVPGEDLQLATWQELDISGVDVEVKVYSRNVCADGGKSLDGATRYRIVASNFLPGIETPTWLDPDFAAVRWGPLVHHEDEIKITKIPIVGTRTYHLEQEDVGPVTPSFSID